MAVVRRALCEECGHEFFTRKTKPQCGKCGSREVSIIDDIFSIESKETATESKEAAIADMPPPKPRTTFKMSRRVVLTPEDLVLAQKFINAGIASDLTDVVKKGLLAFAGLYFRDLYGLRGGEMEELMKKLIDKAIERGIDPLSAAMSISILRGQLNPPTKNTSLLELWLLTQLTQQRGIGLSEALLLSQMSSKGEGSLKEVINILRQERNRIDPNLLLILASRGQTIPSELIKALTERREEITVKDILGMFGEAKKEAESYRKELIEKEREMLAHKFEEKLGAVMGELQKLKEGKKKSVDELLESLDKLKTLGEKLGVIKPTEKTREEHVKDILKLLVPTFKDMMETYAKTKTTQPSIPIRVEEVQTWR